MSVTTRPAAPAGFEFELGELAAILGAGLDGPTRARAGSYAVDSRAVVAGTVFFALPGARTDGHRHLAEVLAAGAAAAVVKATAAVPPGLAALRVADPAEALGRLGHRFRHGWPLEVVGITGSAGKTTTKDFAAHLLAGRRRVFRSEGNLNSTIGLPLTLARRRPEDELAVLELGMSFPGELARLARLACPDVAVVTNVGLAHAQNFPSADDIARAKAEILEGVPAGGTFVANADDARVRAMAERFPGRVVTFAVTGDGDVRASGIEACGPAGSRFTVHVGGRSAAAAIGLAGRHQVANAVAALAVAHALGIDPLELTPRLPTLRAAEHRGGLLHLPGDVLVLDDCYNASPAAVAAALDTLASLPARRRLAVLGDMRELGAYSAEAHRAAGRLAAARADLVLGVGPESRVLVEEARRSGCAGARHVDDAAAAAAIALAELKDGDAVLVKGSRLVGLEAVVEALCRARAGAAAAGRG